MSFSHNPNKSEAGIDFSLRVAPTVRKPIVKQIRTFVPFGRYDEPQIPAMETLFLPKAPMPDSH